MDNINETNVSSNNLFLTLFNNPADAARAYNYLINKGYKKDDITVIMSDETREKYFANSSIPNSSLETKAAEGAGIGSAIGGAIGAIAGAIAAIGTVLTIPGLGLIIAGPIAVGLAGAGAGSAIGGLAGALVGSGVTDENAQVYENKIKEGGILVGVHTNAANFLTLEKELENSSL